MIAAAFLGGFFYQESHQFYWQEVIAIFIPKNSPECFIIMTKNDEGFYIFIEDLENGENIITILQSYWQKYAPENANQTFPAVEEYKEIINAYSDESTPNEINKSWLRKTFDILLLIISALAIFILSIVILDTFISKFF